MPTCTLGTLRNSDGTERLMPAEPVDGDPANWNSTVESYDENVAARAAKVRGSE
jgi:hypothetical protein